MKMGVPGHCAGAKPRRRLSAAPVFERSLKAMLGLKLTGRLGRRAGHWLLSFTFLVLAACSSTIDNAATGSGGSASGGTASGGGGGTTVTFSVIASQVGVITLWRLNRVEYGNTLRDLTGTTKDHGQSFPLENLSFGF